MKKNEKFIVYQTDDYIYIGQPYVIVCAWEDDSTNKIMAEWFYFIINDENIEKNINACRIFYDKNLKLFDSVDSFIEVEAKQMVIKALYNKKILPVGKENTELYIRGLYKKPKLSEIDKKFLFTIKQNFPEIIEKIFKFTECEILKKHLNLIRSIDIEIFSEESIL